MSTDVDTGRTASAAQPVNHSTIVVSEADAASESAWQLFVEQSETGSPFHELGWKRAVERVYGHHGRYLVARADQDGPVVGLLPLYEVKGPFTGRALIAIPYAVYGGAIAKSPAIANRLHQRATTLAERLGSRYLEIRGEEPIEGYVNRSHYLTFRKRMPDDPSDVLAGYPRKSRAAIRNAIKKFGLHSRFGAELLDEFYRLYVHSLRRLASPPHSKQFFRALLDEYGERAVVQIVYHEQTPIAGVFSFRFRNQILPYWAGIDARYNQMNTSNFLYYSLMEHAVSWGLEVFDFGRTRIDNEGGCSFKINQGFEPSPLHYSTYSPGGDPPPDLRPSNAKFSLAQKIWKRLPLGVVTLASRPITRWLP